MSNNLAVLLGTSEDGKWGLRLRFQEQINKSDTSISVTRTIFNTTTNNIVIENSGKYIETEAYGESVYDPITSIIQVGTYEPLDSLVGMKFRWLKNRIPHTSYINGYYTLPVNVSASITIGDETTTININSVVELTLLTDSSNVVYTSISEEDKTAILDGSVAIRTKLIVQPDAKHTGYITLTEEDSIKDWTLSDDRYVPDEGFIGQFVARTLNGSLQNINDTFNIENRDVQLLLGVVRLGSRYQYLETEDGEILIDEFGNKITTKDLGDDITTWYSLGNFLITKPEDDEVADNTTFESFDYTTKFNADFNADFTSANFPLSFNQRIAANIVTTIEQLAQYTCEQVGISLGSFNFTNSDFQITSNQFTEGNSCRDVMKAIAQLALGWCRIGWDNKCYIDTISTTSATADDTTTLTNDSYYSLKTQKEKYGPINRISVGMSSVEGENVYIEDETSISANGITELVINDNPLLYTEELRNSFIDTTQTLMGLTYTPFDTETPGHPWFVGNERLLIKNMEGSAKYTYPFNKTLNYTGHIKTTLNTPAPTKQEISTGYNRTLYKTIRDVGIKVNKQEGVINIVNSNLQATMDGLSSVERRLDTEITDTYTKTQIQEIINGTAADGTTVTSVKSAAGTFDMNGLTIEQSDADTKTNINADGMKIYNAKSGLDSDPLLDVNSEGVDAENIKVRTYLNIGSHSRMEDYTDPSGETGTGIFWIGGGY